MSISSVMPPYPLYTGTDGQPLEAGYIWIGQPFLDGRAYPKQAYWDGALSIPAGQPIRTINGYASQNGSPGRLFVDGDYSTLVLDKRGMQVYYAPSRLLDAPLTYDTPFYARGDGVTATFALPESWAAYTNNTHLQFWVDGGRVYPDKVTVADGYVTFENVPAYAAVDNIYGEVATVGPESAVGVRGPSSSTDNAIALFDGTTGRLLKNGVTYNNIPVTATGGTVARTLAERFADTVNVLDYGAVGDGVTDDSAAFQAAVDTGKPVFVPSLSYIVATPVEIGDNTVIYGQGNGNYQSGPEITPTTAAFRSATPEAQLTGLLISGLCFIGGSIVLDLGLFHAVTLENLSFDGPSVAAISIIRGEQMSLSNLTTRAATAGTSVGLLSLCDITVSTHDYSGWSGDLFIYRVTMDGLYASNSPVGSGRCAWVISHPEGFFSGADVSNVVGYMTSEGVMRLTDVEASVFSALTAVDVGTGFTPSTGVYTFNSVFNCVFNAIMIDPDGGSYYAAFMLFTGSLQNSIFNSCYAPGDNSTIYGIKIALPDPRQRAVFNACGGAIYSAGASSLARAAFVCRGCNWTFSNIGSGQAGTPGSGENAISYQSRVTQYTAINDAGLLNAATGILYQWTRATGAGNQADFFRLTDTNTRFYAPTNPYHELVSNSGSAQWVAVSGTPEASVSAPVGSIASRVDGSTGTTLYVKSTGTGNTGWDALVPAGKTTTLTAASSAGITIRNSSGTDVALFGAGPGTGVTFNGGVTVAGNATLGDATGDAHTLTGTVYLGNAAGAESLRVIPAASANRYVTITGSNGGNPTIGASAGALQVTSTTGIIGLGTLAHSAYVVGADSNIDIYLDGASVTYNGRFFTKGNGELQFFTGGYTTAARQFNIAHAASAVNYLQVVGAATGANPVLSAQGTNTNIGMNFNGKGSGPLMLNFANIALLTSTGSFGGASGSVFIANCSVAPSSNPAGGGILYVEAGTLKYRGSSGTVTTIANA